MKKHLLALFLLLASAYSLHAQYNKQYIYYMGQNSIVRKDYYHAINLLTILIEADTLSKEAYFLRAVAKYNINDIIGAENDFSNAIRVNPVYVEAYQYRAVTRSMLGNYNDALDDYGKALEIRPDYYNTYYSRGVTLFLNQQLEEAIADFDAYLSREPKSVDALINRGVSYLMLKDTLKAYENFDSAVRAAPRNSDAYLRRGSLLALRGEYGRALEDLDKAVAYDSKSIPAYFNRALAYANSNRPMQAIDDFTRILAIDSTNSLTYFNRALLRSQIGDYNRALEDYGQVVRYSPSNVLVYYNRGGLNYRLGNLEEAFDDYSTAISLYPDFANAYLNRASIRSLLNDREGAEKDRKTAERKIEEYNNRFRSGQAADDFDRNFADTSRLLNRLLSFDSQAFNRADRDNVQNRNADIALLPLYKFAVLRDTGDNRKAAENRDIAAFLREAGVRGLTIANRPGETADSLFAPPLHAKTETVYFLEGVREYSRKQYTNAINQYNRAIAADPHNAFFYFNRSSARYEMIEFISSLEGREQSLIVGADRSKTLDRGKRVYDYREALADIDYALKLNPYVPYFHYNRGNILGRSGDLPGAIEAYTQAVRLDPSFAEAYYNRGLVQIYLKDTRKGYLDISRAGELGLPEAYRKLREFSRER